MQSDANLRKKSCLTREIINKMNESKNLSPPFSSLPLGIPKGDACYQRDARRGGAGVEPVFFDDY